MPAFQNHRPNSDFLLGSNIFPCSFWTPRANELFYNGNLDPLKAFGTLGSSETLLARAFASYAKSKGTKTIHEVGSGNFAFAKKVLENTPGVEYHAYDAFDSSFLVHQNDLPKALSFHKCSARELNTEIDTRSEPIIVGVELCDDLVNECWTIQDGKPAVVCVKFAVDRKFDLPIVIDARDPIVDGNLLQNGAILLSRQRFFPAIDAELLRSILDDHKNWDLLQHTNPGFLTALDYDFESCPYNLESILKQNWSGLGPEFIPTGKKILEIFEEHLKQIPSPGLALHIPSGAIALLWRFRNHPNTEFNFFDYGYESPQMTASSPFRIFQGQPTSDVNFGIMTEAAKLMGYEVTLQKDREFIQQHTGEDTLIIASVGGLLDPDLEREHRSALLFHYFAKAVGELCPDMTITPENIRGCRVRRSEVDKVASMLGTTYYYSDTNYHFYAKNAASPRL